MNEPVTKSRPQIDVEEFERYLRETTKAPQSQEDDPLAELARLVSNGRDPYDEVFSRGGEGAPSHGSPDSRRQAIDFAAIEAGLRGSLPGHETEQAQTAGHYPQGAYADGNQGYYDPQGSASSGGQQNWGESAPVAPSYPAQRSRRPVYAMAVVILAGVAGIGIAFAYKGNNSGPREVAMIKAAPGPAKIQPPADAPADQPARDGSVLDNAQQPAPTKTVTREEQPVDLAQNVQNTPRDTSNGITPIYNFGMAGPNGEGAPPASGLPASQPPAPSASAAGTSDTHGAASDMQPIRVKTRSYRPDGTPIPNDHIPAAAIDNAAAAPAKPNTDAVAKASTPKAQTPAKTTTRAAPAAKSVVAAKPVAPRPIVVASRDPDAPTDLTPATARPATKPVKPVKPLKIADAADDAAISRPAAVATRAGGGGFTVQLAAPGSEAEAKQTSSRLEQKFASELEGHHLATYKAVSNGKTVYRVRAGSMTREEATGLCEKLKASGGSCFIAKN